VDRRWLREASSAIIETNAGCRSSEFDPILVWVSQIGTSITFDRFLEGSGNKQRQWGLGL
jgi:hypothetical protein